jgi:hypothetical protein
MSDPAAKTSPETPDLRAHLVRVESKVDRVLARLDDVASELQRIPILESRVRELEAEAEFFKLAKH